MDMPAPPKTSPADQIAALVKAVAVARETLVNCQKDEADARRACATAANRLEDAEKALDTAMKAFAEASPRRP